MPSRLLLLVRIDARRPAAWLTLAAAAAAGMLSAAPFDAGPTPAVWAVVVGVVLAVAALGDVTPQSSGAICDTVWCAERAAWPLVGWLAAAACLGAGGATACGAVGSLAGGAMYALLCRRGLLAADAASVTLVVACCAGAAGWWADAMWPGRMPGAWLTIAGLGGVAAAVWAVPGVRELATVASLRSSARHLLTAAAMMGSMAGMVGWLFLAAEHAIFDLVASLAWFAALAVPSATMGDGVSHAAVWRRLERAAPRGRLRLGPGRTRDGVQAVVTAAAVVGWPPLVAAALAGGDAARSGAAWLVVSAIAAAAILLLGAVGLGRLVGATPDTQLAVVVVTCLVPALLACLGLGF
jgi:hypothetical protein